MAAEQSSQETAVGIKVYLSPDVPGFRCILKQRYTDFLVNEILQSGEVLHLLNTNTAGSRQGQKRSRDDDANGYPDAAMEDAAPGAKVSGENSSEVAGDSNESVPPNKRQRTSTEDPALTATSNGHGNTTQAEDGATNRERKEQAIATLSEADKAKIQAVFGDEVTSKVLDLYAEIVVHPTRKPRDHASIKSNTIAEKSQRTEAHVAVRQVFAGKLETATLQDQPGIISIKAAATRGPSGVRSQANGDAALPKGKVGWNELGGEYLHFTLYKENKDTMEALGFIASQLKVQPNSFQFAGTKDRRGVTTQRVAIYRVRADQLAKLNKTARGWRVGDFTYEKHALDLGDSNGNEFLLTLRDCRFDGEDGLDMQQRIELASTVVKQATRSFQDKGFLNYFGLQRFGSYKVGTHTIGQKMLQGDLKGAIDCILTYDPNMLSEAQDPNSSNKVPQDDIARADAIKSWRQTGQSGEIVRNLPRRFSAESTIIQYLSKKDRKTGKLAQDQDWQGALTTIQRNLRLMYVHAYQSFVWNVMAGERWEMFGDQVVAGDLVIVGEKDDKTPTKAQVDEEGEPVFHPAAHDSAQDAADAFTRARPLTEAEAESGKFNIFDIVLPLPGYDIEYPPNAIGKRYEEFMASETGGRLDPHNMRRSWKDLSLSGAYRKMLSKPGAGFSYELKAYRDDNEQMVETDLERLKKQDRSQTNSNENGVALNGAGSDDKDKIALVLKFQLGSSQYATMALRELTKGGAGGFKPEFSAR